MWVAFQEPATPRGSSFESNQTVAVAVTLYPASAATVTVQYAVSGGTATQGSDYTLAAGTLVFWPYDTVKTIPLAIKEDAAAEPDETVEITLTAVSGNAGLGGNRTYTHTIVDTDAVGLAAPVITPSGTVRFTNWVEVAIAPPAGVSNVTVRYTTDGTQPDGGSALYTGSFVLTASARVTARSFLGSYNASPTTSALFLGQTPAPGGYAWPYWLGVLTNGSGTVSGGNRWLSSGSNVTVQAAAATYYHFDVWSGDVGTGLATNPVMSVLMNSNRVLVADFAPSLTSRQTPWWWLAQYYVTNSFEAVDLSDTDGDGMAAWGEYQAGTVPTDALSVLAVLRGQKTSGGFSVSWPAVPGRVYSVYRSTNLALGWQADALESNLLPDVSGTNVFSDPSTNSRAFYRIGVELQ